MLISCATAPAVQMLSDMDVLALILAAASHDVEHPGRSNNFLKATKSPLAILYNDQSVLGTSHYKVLFCTHVYSYIIANKQYFSRGYLENHHASVFFQQMTSEPGLMIFEKLDNELEKELRKSIIRIILATDLARHFELVGKLSSILSTTKSSSFCTPQECEDVQKQGEFNQLITDMLMKCADVSHPTRKFVVHQRWSLLMAEEFFSQGDEEQVLNLPISPFCDRKTFNMTQSQTGFMKILVQPLYSAFASALEGGDEESDKFLQHLTDRVSYIISCILFI